MSEKALKIVPVPEAKTSPEAKTGAPTSARLLARIGRKRLRMHHQLGGTHLRIGAGDRKLHALILSDRPSEQLAVLGILRGLGDEPFGIANAFRRDQDALGIHPRKNVAKSLPFLANQVFGRHAQIVEENLRGGVVHHGADRIDGDARALCEPHVDQKYRQAICALFRLFLRGGAREQQHQIGMLGARGPDLLAIDDIVIVAFALCRRAQGQCVRPGCWLGDSESLQTQFAAGDQRQVALFLRVAAMYGGIHRRWQA